MGKIKSRKIQKKSIVCDTDIEENKQIWSVSVTLYIYEYKVNKKLDNYDYKGGRKSEKEGRGDVFQSDKPWHWSTHDYKDDADRRLEEKEIEEE